MKFRFKSKIMLLLILCSLLIGLILPASATDSVNNGAFNAFALKNNAYLKENYVQNEILVRFNPGVSEEKIKKLQ